MKALLVRHVKVIDELGNIVEIKIWKLPKPTTDKPHGYKYSLVYIADGERVIGYDNAEGKGDHCHYGKIEKLYEFKNIDKLFEDFYRDIRRFKHEG
jgi:predicted transcriptional regulator